MTKTQQAKSRIPQTEVGRDVGARRRTRHAYREILRLIHSRHLQPGELLPRQSDLLGELGMCQGTLSAAMGWLVEDGVLRRRKCAGTTVVRLLPDNPRRLIWSVGIVMPDVYETPFFPTLTHFLHKHLALNGCADRVYILSPHAAPTDRVTKRVPADFSGLEEDMAGGILDALITPTRLTALDIPVCAAAGPETARFGVLLDQAALVRQACAVLWARGKRRLAVAVTLHEEPGYAHYWEGFAAAMTEHGLTVSEADRFVVGSGLESGRRLAERLLALPAGRRPDGLVVLDDIAAQGLTVHLQGAGSYRPALAVQTNRQAPVAFAWPVSHFEFDVERLAEKAVHKTLALLLNPGLPLTVDWMEAELAATPRSGDRAELREVSRQQLGFGLSATDTIQELAPGRKMADTR